MLRGDRDSPAAEQSPPRGPAPKRRHHPQDDPRDVDERETAIGRMVVRAGLGGSPKRKSDPRHIVISRPVVREESASSDSESEDLPYIKKSKR